MNNVKIKKTYPYLARNLDCDVIVAGGGISSAITSFFLAKEGFKILVVEKNIIGFENTSISSACVTDFIDEMYVKEFSGKDKSLGYKISNLKRKANSLLDEILVDIKLDKYIDRNEYYILNNMMFQNKALKNEMNIREELGEKVDITDKKNSIRIKDNSRILNSYELASNIYEYISKFPNVYIFENTIISSINSFYDYVEIESQNNFKIRAGALVISSPLEGVNIASIPNIDINRRFSVRLKTDIKENKCIKVLHDIPVYIKMEENGNMTVSGIDTKYNFKMENYKYLENLEKENAKHLINVIKRIYPKVEMANEISICSGNIYSSKDNLPIISEIENYPNVYLNIGMGSSSIMQCLVGADLIKEAIKGYYMKEMNIFKLRR